jgi:hypothetical protein
MLCVNCKTGNGVLIHQDLNHLPVTLVVIVYLIRVATDSMPVVVVVIEEEPVLKPGIRSPVLILPIIDTTIDAVGVSRIRLEALSVIQMVWSFDQVVQLERRDIARIQVA